MSFKVKLTDEEYKQYVKDMSELGSEYKDKIKTLPIENQYDVYFLDGTKVSYDSTLISALKKGIEIARSEEDKKKIQAELSYITKQILNKNI